MSALHRRLGATTIYVTHDQVEAMTMADRIVVMDKGKIQQVGTPREIYLTPRNMFVAGFIGAPAMNFINVKVTNEGILVGDRILNLPDYVVEQLIDYGYLDSTIVLGVRPEHIYLSQDADRSLLANAFEIKIKVAEMLSNETLIHFDLADENFIAKIITLDEFEPDEVLEIVVDHARIHFFDPNQEGILNGSFAIVSDMNSRFSKVEDGKYIKLGPIKRVDGTNHLITRYKSGYAGWAVPATTDSPDGIVAFADWLASSEGKLLWNYGIEGVDYGLDENGFPVIHEDLIDELENNPELAVARDFAGVGNNWGMYLGSTDLAHKEDFGEPYYGFNTTDGNSVGTKVANEYYKDKLDDIESIDGMTPKSYLNEFEGSTGRLTTALNRYEEDLVRAFYANSIEEAEEIMQGSVAGLEAAGLEDYQDFINEKVAEGIQFIY